MTLLRINLNPTRTQLRVFSVAWLIFVGVISLRLWSKGYTPLAEMVGGVAVAIPLAGLVWPRGLRHVYVGLTYATYPIGFVLSHVILAILYYGVISPIGLIMKLAGFDPLARRFEPSTGSYWRRRVNPKSTASYLRQI